jgi:hypothetical protein
MQTGTLTTDGTDGTDGKAKVQSSKSKENPSAKIHGGTAAARNRLAMTGRTGAGSPHYQIICR